MNSKTLVILLICLSFGVCIPTISSGQHINSVHTQPDYPVSGDSVYLVVSLTFPSGSCWRNFYTTSSGGNNILVVGAYCTGVLTVICDLTDTLYLGTFPSGNYNVGFDLGIGGFNCDDFITENKDTSFAVGTLPAVSITHSGSGSICSGDTVTLTADSSNASSLQWYKDGNIIPGATNKTYMTSSAGVYSVEASSKYGTAVSAGITLSIVAAIIPTISQNQTLLVSSAALSYLWLDGNGLPINGANMQSFSPPSDGIYQVSTTDTNGCIAVSVPFNYVSTTIKGHNNVDQAIISLNPDGRLLVWLPQNSSEKSTLFLYSIQGLLVKRVSLSSGYNTVDLTSKTEELLIYQLNTEASFSNGKLLIKI